jgi:archaellum component FlaC
MAYLKAALLTALTLGALFFLIEAGILVRRVQMAVPGIASELSATLTDTRRTVVIVGGAATNIERSTRQWKDQSLSQSQAATEATKRLNSDLQELGTLLSTADSALETQSKSLSDLETQVGTSIESTLAQTSPTLLNLSTASESLSKQLPPILDNLSQTSAQTVTISKNVSTATEEVSLTTHDVREVADAFRNDYLKPRNRIWAEFKALLSIGSAAGSISQLAK